LKKIAIKLIQVNAFICKSPIVSTHKIITKLGIELLEGINSEPFPEVKNIFRTTGRHGRKQILVPEKSKLDRKNAKVT